MRNIVNEKIDIYVNDQLSPLNMICSEMGTGYFSRENEIIRDYEDV